jgi:hypothetical protein
VLRFLKFISIVLAALILVYISIALLFWGGFSGMRACVLPDCEKPLQFVHRGVSGLPENCLRAAVINHFGLSKGLFF